jgi:hypothetical protein
MDDQGINREGGGALEAQSSAASIIGDLMIITGAMLLIYAIPNGLFLGARFFWDDWLWAAISFVVMTLVTAAVGGGLLATGLYLWRRQLRDK